MAMEDLLKFAKQNYSQAPQAPSPELARLRELINKRGEVLQSNAPELLESDRDTIMANGLSNTVADLWGGRSREIPQDSSMLRLRRAIDNQKDLVGLTQRSGKANLKPLMDAIKAKDKEAGIQSRADNSNTLKVAQKLSGEMFKVAKEARTNNAMIDQLTNEVMSGEVGRINAALSIIARQIGGEKGALSDTDLVRAAPSNVQTIAANWLSRLESNPREEAPRSLIEHFMSRINNARTQINRKFSGQLDDLERGAISLASQNIPGYKGLGVSRIRDLAKTQRSALGSKLTKEEVKKNERNISRPDVSLNDLEAELKRRKEKK